MEQVQGIIVLLAQFMMAVSVVLGVWALSPKVEDIDEEETDFVPLAHRGQMGAKREMLKETQPLYALTLPLVQAIAKILSMLPLEEFRIGLKNKLIQAGNPGAYSPDEYMAIPFLSAIGFLGAWSAAFYSLQFQPPFAPLVYTVIVLFGLLLPFISLNDAIRRRRAEISKSLPYILDLLTLSIEAGLDFVSAVERIVTKRANQGPLTEELYQMLQEMKMGKTRREALRDLARRVQIDAVKSVVANLIQADQLGTPLGPILRIQSDMQRNKRTQEAEKVAMEAPVKLLFPLLLIFISVMLVLLGPMVIRLTEDNSIF